MNESHGSRAAAVAREQRRLRRVALLHAARCKWQRSLNATPRAQVSTRSAYAAQPAALEVDLLLAFNAARHAHVAGVVVASLCAEAIGQA